MKMKSSMSIHLNNGEMILVNHIPFPFDSKYAKQILSKGFGLAKEGLMRECGFSEKQAEKLFENCMFIVRKSMYGLPAFVRFPREMAQNMF